MAELTILNYHYFPPLFAVRDFLDTLKKRGTYFVPRFFNLSDFLSETRQNILEIIRKLACHLAGLIRARMDKAQGPGVQTLALKPFFSVLFSVDHIAQNRVTDICHMNPDLVCSASLQTALYVSVSVISSNNLIMRYSASGVALCDRHALSVYRVTTDGRIDFSFVVMHSATHNRLIGTAQTVVGKLRG